MSELAIGADRITEIVNTFKTYTYMDQTPVQKVDVKKDIENTLILFHSKIKKEISVIRKYDKNVPAIEAYSSELNQVWTNVIDNAIDVISSQGKLLLRVYNEQSWVVIEITDTGPGIQKKYIPKFLIPF